MTMTRVNEIDLLRFIAALAVVFYHYSFRGYAADAMSVMPYSLLAPAAKYGYLGVELFFMISGFVILMTAANGCLRGFVISRIVRLYPAFWACCTITFAATILIGAPRYSATITQYLVNMTMLSGFVGVPAIDDVYWSLFIELRFYALIAIILMLGKINQAQTFIVLWLIAALFMELYPIGKLQSILITNYAAFFIAGSACFLIWSKGFSLSRAAIILASWGLAVSQSLGHLQSFENHYNTVMNSDVVVGIITTFFVVMIMVSLRLTGWVGRTRWLWAGAVTYPLYLLHQNIGFMVFNQAYPTVSAHLLFWTAVITSILSAYAVHILIEKRYSTHIKHGLNSFTDNLALLTTRWRSALAQKMEG